MARGGSQSWYKIILIVAVYVAVYICFIGESYLIRMVEVEHGMNEKFYSKQVSDRINERGSRWFTLAFVDTQIIYHSFEPFIPTDEEMKKAKGLEEFGKPVFHWWEGRLRAWWTLIWSTFVRVSSLAVWIPYAALFVAPWLVDGLVERKKSKHTFDFSSPVKHRYAMMGIALVPVVFLVAITAPIPLHPLTTPLLLVSIGFLTYQISANFMKRA